MTKWGIPAAVKSGFARRGWAVTKPAPKRCGWAVPLNPYGSGGRVQRVGYYFQIVSPNLPWPSFTVKPTTPATDRFELRANDVTPGDVHKARSENGMNAPDAYLFNTVYWLSFAFRFTGTITADWHVIGQMRGLEDPGDYTGRSPVWAQELYAPNTFQVVTRSDPNAISTGNLPSVIRYQNTNFALGVWHNVVYKMSFARTGNGLLAGWIDGANVIPEAAMPIGYNDTVGPQFKYGVYRGPNGTTPSICEYANLELGTTDLTSRITSPLATPA